MSNRAGDDGGEFLTPEEEKRRRDARVRRAIAADEKEKEIDKRARAGAEARASEYERKLNKTLEKEKAQMAAKNNIVML